MVVTKEDFADWKDNPVTKAFMASCNSRVEDVKEVLSYQAGNDADQDSFYRGFCFAYREIQNFRVDEDEVEN